MEAYASVFVVDDDEAVLDSLHVLLMASGFVVQTYASPRTFLNAYRGQPGCMLLDLCMPEMNGLEVQRELARRGLRIPVIFMTAKASAEEVPARL